MQNKELLAKFYSFVLENQVKDEVLIDDYYQKNKTEENKRELKNACLYAKANIASENKKYKKSINFYKKIINDNLSRDEDENALIKLLICENYTHFDRQEALCLINNYFNSDQGGYDLDYLICYANIAKDKIIEEPYKSILTDVLQNLGYKKELPKNFDEFLELHNLYKKENIQVGQILMLSDNLEQEKLIINFINQTSFSSLAEQLKK